MESERKYIDISRSRTQNKVALILANVFTKNELESIDLYEAKIPKRRDISNALVPIYNKSFKYDDSESKIVIIIDTINTDLFPIKRYYNITISKTGIDYVEIKCNYRDNLMGYIAICIAKAINYLDYSPKINHINMMLILNNYAKELLKMTTPEILIEILAILEYINTKGVLIKSNKYSYIYYVNNIQFRIENYYTSCIKLGIDDGKHNEVCMYFMKNSIGISDLHIMFESAIKSGAQ